MTGVVEAGTVIGLISGVISIVEATRTVYDAAKDAKGQPEAFRQVAARLPLVGEILQSAKERAQTLDDSSREALKPTIISCRAKAENLEELFQGVVRKDDDKWYDRYKKAVRTLGKGDKVECLMEGILNDIQVLACERLAGSATDTQIKELEEAIKEMNKMPSSLPDEAGSFAQTHSGSGDNIGHTGPGTMNLHKGSGDLYHNVISGGVTFGSNSISPTFNIINRQNQQYLIDFQETFQTQSAVISQELRQWQGEPQQTVRSLGTYTKDQLELLDGREPRVTFQEPGINSRQVVVSALHNFAGGLASGIGALAALSLYTSNKLPIRASPPPSQLRGTAHTSTIESLALIDDRWNEAFKLALEASRDDTQNKLSKRHKFLPAAREVVHLNQEAFTSLDARLKSWKLRKSAASTVSGTQSREFPRGTHMSYQIRRFLTEDDAAVGFRVMGIEMEYTAGVGSWSIEDRLMEYPASLISGHDAYVLMDNNTPRTAAAVTPTPEWGTPRVESNFTNTFTHGADSTVSKYQAEPLNMRTISAYNRFRSNKVPCSHTGEICRRFSSSVEERYPMYQLPWENLKGYLGAMFPELAFCRHMYNDDYIFKIPRRLTAQEREAISELREYDNKNPPRDSLSSDEFEKKWKSAISSPKFILRQAVWANLGGHGICYMHIASEGKYAGASEGWTYQLADHEGRFYKDGEWVSEGFLQAA